MNEADIEFRNLFMSIVLYDLREAYGDLPESVLESVNVLDKMLCDKLGLDADKLPDFDQ